MTCGIYMIQNKVNGKIYIGQSVDINSRWGSHKGELRYNSHYNKHLQKSWNKYGEDNFEFTIICECNENQLNTMEEYYIFELMTYDPDFGYNKSYGGGGCRATEETRKKISDSSKGKIISEETRKKLIESHKGKTLSEEQRRKISEALKGRIISEETRKKISEANKIVLNRPEVRKKISEANKGENHPNYGKHLSEEQRRKISEALKGENAYWYGKTHSEETRKKLSEANKGKTHSEETRKKMSESQKIAQNRPEVKKKLSEAHKGEKHHYYGKHLSEEHRKKLSEAHKGEKNHNYGKHFSEDHKRKISEANKVAMSSPEVRKKLSENNTKYWKGKFGVKNPSSIPIVQLTPDGQLVNIYGSSCEAERSGFKQGNISKCLKGERKKHGGYKWMYLHEYISNMHPNIKTINLFGKTYEVNQEEVK